MIYSILLYSILRGYIGILFQHPVFNLSEARKTFLGPSRGGVMCMSLQKGNGMRSGGVRSGEDGYLQHENKSWKKRIVAYVIWHVIQAATTQEDKIYCTFGRKSYENPINSMYFILFLEGNLRKIL